MPSPLKIELTFTNTNGAAVTGQAREQIEAVKKSTVAMGNETVAAADKADRSLKGMFKTTYEGIGRKDISRAFAGAFIGLDSVLTVVGDKLDANTKKTVDMAKAATGVVTAFAFGGPIGGTLALLGVGLGVVIDQLQEAQRQADLTKAAIIAPFKDATAEVQKFYDKVKEDPLQALADMLGITTAQVREYAAANLWAYNNIQRLNAGEAAITTLEQNRAAAQEQLSAAHQRVIDAQHNLNEATAQGNISTSGMVDALHQALLAEADARDMVRLYAAAIREAKGETAGLTANIAEGIPVWDRAALSLGDLKDVATGLIGVIGANGYQPLSGTYLDIPSWDRAGMTIGDVKQTLTEYGNVQEEQKRRDDQLAREGEAASKAYASAWKSAVESIARSLISPTSVTADQFGPGYKNQWDEYARRMKDIENLGAKSPWAKLAPPDVLAKGEAALKGWAAAEDKAFYSGQRMNQVNAAAWIDDFNAKVDEAIGNYDLMQKAQQTVTEQLKQMQKDDPLKYNKFLAANNLPLTTSAGAAAKAVTGMKDEINKLPAKTDTTANFNWNSGPNNAKSMIDAAHEWLYDKILKYGNIDIIVRGQFEPPPGGEDGGNRNGHGPYGGEYAAGGAGVFPRDQYIKVHAGEPYQIGANYVGGGGGLTVIVPVDYHPYASLSDREQFGDEIVPLIVTRLERELSRKFVRRG